VRCDGDDEAEAPYVRRIGASYAWFRSDLVWGDARTPITRHGVVASIELPLGARDTLSVGLGADLAGSMKLDSRRFSLGPGWVGSASFSHRIVDGAGALPFVLLSGALSASGTTTREDGVDAPRGHLLSIDVKGGVTIGKTFGDVVSPYVAFRAFGGPVFWSELADRTGTDAYHVQPAAGLVLALGRRLALFGEVAPVAERAIAAGASVGF
jgi:hypothetical protein